MAGASARRPIPAIVFILLLSLLSAIVWYRVLNRSQASSTTGSSSSPSTSASCVHKTTPAVKAVVWPKTTSVHLRVLNATERNGLAKAVSSQLHARGFVTGAVGNDTVSNATVTQVRYGTRAAVAARLIQLYLPGSRLVPNTSKATTVVVAVGSSYKRLSTNAQVAKAKKTAKPATTC